jgi:hypothetical protein
MHLVERTDEKGSFTKQELARLTVYRAAVAAGFYTDWDGSADSTDTEALAGLQAESGSTGAAVEYPFTQAERERLERCRAAVEAGYYTDDQPPVDASGAPDGTSE